MRLAAFIRANTEQIAANWERFATTLLPDMTFSKSVLRDHIVEMLNEITTDMESDQSEGQQQQKSQGDAEPNWNIDDAANRHALQRVEMGVSSRQLISEFRALRATIIRLWQQSGIQIDKTSLYDLTRFNEAVDELLSRAAMSHTEETNRSRDLFLGILGHDLRNPLAAISGWAELQLRAETLGGQADLASRILVSSARLSYMITDLIELTRVRLGSGIPINPVRTNMRCICANAIEEMEAIHPNRVFQLNCDHEFPGDWDAGRMTQVLSNLLGNAVYHGDSSFPIAVTVKSDGNGVQLAVHNEGDAIPADVIPKIFESLFQGGSNGGAGLGLGLYIAKEIISAHGGTIEVRSSDDEGTTFIARIPYAPQDRERQAVAVH